MSKLAVLYSAILFGLVPSLYSVNSVTVTTNAPTFTPFDLTSVRFSQTVSFTNLTTDTLSIRFPWIDTAFLNYDPLFRTPVNEIARILKVSLSGSINQTPGSIKIGSNTSSSPRSFSIIHTALANFSSPDLTARSISLANGLSFLQGSNEIDLSGSKSGFVSGGSSISESFDAFLNYGSANGWNFSSNEQLFGFSDWSKFMGEGDFVIQLDSEVFSSTGTSLIYEVTPPSFFGNLVLTYEIIPEPSSASLLALGVGGLIAIRRMRRKAD